MPQRPWGKWFWNDWRGDPGLRSCSLSARGLWMDMLCIAAESDPTGYVLVNGRTLSATDLARLTGAPEADVQAALAELDLNGVFSRDRNGRIYNRRMVRDAKETIKNRKNGKLGGNPSLRKQTEKPPPDNPSDNLGDKAHKPEARGQREVEREESKSQTTHPNGRAPPGAVIDFEFAEFWRAYPRRDDRGHALKAYRVARKRIGQEVLVAAARRYSEERAGQDPKYTALAATWLTGERWADETTPPARGFTIGVG